MSHVDEGALHAYLDGALDEYPAADAERIRAHLDACAECAEQLEEERRIRSDAHALLGMAAPEVELPSFEELRAYVQRTRRQGQGISRLRRLGWAASIVVAVGAGWMLREGQLQSRALDIRQEMAPAARMAPSTGAPAGSVDAPERELIARPYEQDVASRAEGSGNAAFADRSDEAPVQPVPTSADLGGAEANRVLDPIRLEVEPVAPAAADASARVAEADALRGVAADTGAGAVAGEAAGVAAPAAAVDMAAAEEPAVAGERTAVDEVVAATGPDSLERMIAEVEVWPMTTASQARARPAAPSVVTSALQAVPVEATSRQAEAEARPEAGVDDEADAEVGPEPLLSVPGHEVLDVTNLGEGSTSWGVRVRQRAADGRAFEVVHLERGIDPAILPDPEPGVEEVRAETDFGWLLVRGPMSRQELEELLARLLSPMP